MSCDVTKFVISRGSDNTFIFTIKQDNSTLALVIKGTDTFHANLISLETGITHPSVSNKALTVLGDGTSGRVELSIPAADTLSMVAEKGGKADRYYGKPSYKLVMDCSTENNDDFIAKVAEVYVD